MFNLVVEGNIGSGKSTFLKILNQTLPNQINVFAEPVEQWRNLNGHNLFELMYQNPTRWSFTFQSYVQLTMLQMHDRIRSGHSTGGNHRSSANRHKVLQSKPLATSDRLQSGKQATQSKRKRSKLSSKSSPLTDCFGPEMKQELQMQLQNENHQCLNVMERSIFSARYIFIENLFQSSLLTEIEYTILNESFEYMVKTHDIQLDLIIYLRCPPQRCYERMLSRSRPEETSSLTLDHFIKFHELHECFLSENGLFRRKYKIPVIIIESLESLDEMQKAASVHSQFILNSLQSTGPQSSMVC